MWSISTSAREPADDDPPVVLLHGASGNLEDMRLALADRLKQHHRVILLDRPGHGWSEREADDASPARQAAMVARGAGAARYRARHRGGALVCRIGRDRAGARGSRAGRRSRADRAGALSVVDGHRLVLQPRGDADCWAAVRAYAGRCRSARC